MRSQNLPNQYQLYAYSKDKTPVFAGPTGLARPNKKAVVNHCRKWRASMASYPVARTAIAFVIVEEMKTRKTRRIYL